MARHTLDFLKTLGLREVAFEDYIDHESPPEDYVEHEGPPEDYVKHESPPEDHVEHESPLLRRFRAEYSA